MFFQKLSMLIFTNNHAGRCRVYARPQHYPGTWYQFLPVYTCINSCVATRIPIYMFHSNHFQNIFLEWTAQLINNYQSRLQDGQLQPAYFSAFNFLKDPLQQGESVFLEKCSFVFKILSFFQKWKIFWFFHKQNLPKMVEKSFLRNIIIRYVLYSKFSTFTSFEKKFQKKQIHLKTRITYVFEKQFFVCILRQICNNLVIDDLKDWKFRMLRIFGFGHF